MKYSVVQDTEPTPCPCCRQDAYAWRVTGPNVPADLRDQKFYGEDGQQEALGYADSLSQDDSYVSDVWGYGTPPAR